MTVNAPEIVQHYGKPMAEYRALRESAGIIDASSRSRLCVTGADRVKFLHGQVTNNVKDLQPGQGCYAALVSARGKIQSDLRIYILENEILLDFEPGLAGTVQSRLEKHIIAEDVQVADVSAQYGLWRVQGPKAVDVISKLPWKFVIPGHTPAVASLAEPALGELYLTAEPGGFGIYAPTAAMPAIGEGLKKTGAPLCGWQALETARIEAGIPRFGADMDETNLAPEVLGVEAISYSKGCYIGQEVIARIRTYGQVARSLRGLLLPDNLPAVPARGDKLLLVDKEVGYVTSATFSPRMKTNIALACIRREANSPGTELRLQTSAAKIPALVVDLPFVPHATGTILG